jgi:FtsP/CotA-like multicopper oxidase with cupredoxin domain
MDRRTFLKGMASLPLAVSLGSGSLSALAADAPSGWSIKAVPGSLSLPDGVTLPIKNYQVAGEGVLRTKAGQSLSILLENKIGEATSFELQNLIAPMTHKLVDGDILRDGQEREIQFTPNHPGTHWLRPAMFHGEQLGQGLALPVIVEEEKPYDVDFDDVALVQDWRVNDEGGHAAFKETGTEDRAGRLGQYVTINHQALLKKKLPAGKRVRLRVINACLSRTLVITNTRPGQQNLWVIARDGRPLTGIAQLISKGVALGAGQTADLVFDMPNNGEVFRLTETRYQAESFLEYTAVQKEAFVVRREYSPLPPTDKGIVVPPHDSVASHIVEASIVGGMKGQLPESMSEKGVHWGIEFTGEAASFKTETINELVLRNDTSFEHSIELSGITAQISGLADYIGDSVLVMPGMSVRLRFIPRQRGSLELFSRNQSHYITGLRQTLPIT